jgi:DNA-binding transcriptional ArsR family regulator
MEQIFVDPIFTNPGEVIPIIKALADPTRLGMLLTMNSFAPKGCTASQLADKLSKKIPTILHHLEMLQELGLADYQMEKNEAGREIKHWKVTKTNFQLDINLDLFSDINIELDELILMLFEQEKLAKNIITINFGRKNTPKNIQDKLSSFFKNVAKYSARNVTELQAQEIHSRLQKKTDLVKYLRKWILQAFKASGGTLQLNYSELGNEFNLGDELQKILYESFMRSQKFQLSNLEEGQRAPRIMLKPQYVDDFED